MRNDTWKSADTQMAQLYRKLGTLQHDPRNQELYSLVLREIKKYPLTSLLDIGCGPGHFLALARSVGYQVLGLEPSNKIIRLNRKLYTPPLPIVNARVEDIDRQVKKTVEVVTMLDVLEHIEDDVAALRKIHSIIKDGGLLVLVVPQHPWLYGKRDKQIGHFRRYSAKSLCHVLIRSGFTPITHRSWNAIGVPPYFISERVFQRPLTSNWRGQSKKSGVASFLRAFLFWWLRVIERKTDLGFGLSLIYIARKTKRGWKNQPRCFVDAMAVSAA